MGMESFLISFPFVIKGCSCFTDFIKEANRILELTNALQSDFGDDYIALNVKEYKILKEESMSVNKEITYGLASSFEFFVGKVFIEQDHHSVKATNELDAMILMCKMLNDEWGEDYHCYITDGIQIYPCGGYDPDPCGGYGYDDYLYLKKDRTPFNPSENPYLNPDNGEFNDFLNWRNGRYDPSIYSAHDNYCVAPCYTAKSYDDKEVGCYADIETALYKARHSAKKICKKNPHCAADIIVTVYDPSGNKVGYIDVNGTTHKCK